jgi:hypothetical protein
VGWLGDGCGLEAAWRARWSGPGVSGAAERWERRMTGVVRGWCPSRERNRGGPAWKREEARGPRLEVVGWPGPKK